MSAMSKKKRRHSNDAAEVPTPGELVEFTPKDLDLTGYALPLELAHDWHLCQWIPPGMSPGGLIIPLTAHDETPRAVIIVSGPGKQREVDGARLLMSAKPGDVVRVWGQLLEWDRRKALFCIRDAFVVAVENRDKTSRQGIV